MTCFFGLRTALAALVLCPLAAHATELECAMTPGGDAANIVADKIYVSYDPKAASAKVLDGIVQHFNGGPMAAKVTTPSDKQVAFTWKVLIPDAVQAATLQYRMTWIKAGNVAVMTVKPLNYSNEFQARGVCTVK